LNIFNTEAGQPMKKTMNITEFAGRIGVIPDTVRRWERMGKIIPNRTHGGHRRYTQEHLQQILGQRAKQKDKRKVIYCRVSSKEQQAEMESQITAMELFALGRGINTETIAEFGDAMSLARPMLIEIILGIIAGEIDRVIVAHKDRLGRFGFEFIESIAKAYGCEIITVDNHRLSPHHEVVSDFSAVMDVFSHRIEWLSEFEISKEL